MNSFSRFFCWLHNVLFHCWIHVVFSTYIFSSYNFSSSIILLVKTFTRIPSFSFPPTIGTMYFVGINGCNPYTNWYGVYHVATLYTFLYEINTINKCSSQSIIFSPTNLVNNVLDTLLEDLASQSLEDNRL